jgi:putative transposase
LLVPINTPVQEVLRRRVEFTHYTSVEFGQHCLKMGVRPSMGSVGDACDNAVAESFLASLECELIDRRRFETKAAAQVALFTWIEGWYNPRRSHSGLGRVSPINFERRHAIGKAAETEHPIATPENARDPSANPSAKPGNSNSRLAR